MSQTRSMANISMKVLKTSTSWNPKTYSIFKPLDNTLLGNQPSSFAVNEIKQEDRGGLHTEMNTVTSTPRLLLSNFLALLWSGSPQGAPFPVPLLPRGSALFFTGLFLSLQLSVGVSRAWGTHRKEDLQGDFDWALVPKPWAGPPSVSPPTAAWQRKLGGSLLGPAAAEHHGGTSPSTQLPAPPRASIWTPGLQTQTESFASTLGLQLIFQMILLP